jgi:hypothetical protein
MNEFIARNGVIAQNNSIVTGSLIVTQGISGSFSGSGANLFNIPASGITGLNLSQISSGSVSASISPNSGLEVNTNVVATSFTGSFSGSGANLFNLPTASATTNGIITTGSQTIAGAKTFTSQPTIPANGGNSGQGAIIIDNGSGLVQVAYNGVYPSLTELAYVKGVTSPIQPQIDATNVNVITITTTTSIDTNTTGSSGYGQHGRHTKISNAANAINLTVQTSSNAEFVASYDKIGTSTITFVAGTGATLTTLSGTAALSGVAGSKACLSRNGNTYFLQITNY